MFDFLKKKKETTKEERVKAFERAHMETQVMHVRLKESKNKLNEFLKEMNDEPSTTR